MYDFKFVHVTGLNLNLGGISHTWIMKIKTKLKSKGAFLLSSVFFLNVLRKTKGRFFAIDVRLSFAYASEDYC